MGHRNQRQAYIDQCCHRRPPDPGGNHDVVRRYPLRTALDALKPIDREALLLTAWEGLPADRAARAAGCSTATFHVRLHRARKRLAHALEEDR